MVHSMNVRAVGGRWWPIAILAAFLVLAPAVILTRAATPNALKGDINGDNVVNVTDLSLLLSNYGKLASASNNPNADVNADGAIGILDLSILLSNYGKSGTPSPSPSPSPVPTKPKIFGANNAVGWGEAARAKQLLGVNGDRTCHDEFGSLDADLGPKIAANSMYLTLCAGNYEGMKSLDAHRQDYAKTMASLAAKYGPGGTYWSNKPGQVAYAIQSFTTMNEPYGWWYRGGHNDPAAYARIARDAVKAGRAANPRAKFYVSLAMGDVKLQNGTWIKWNEAVLQAAPDLIELADGIEVHNYGNPSTVWSQIDAVKSWAWSQRGGNGKPFVVTEMNLTDQQVSSEQAFIDAMPQFVQAAKARPWVHELFIFCWRGYGDLDYLGFLSTGGVVRQARADAYRNAIAR